MSEYLDELTLLNDPVEQLKRWLKEAVETGMKLPDAMTLATATQDGKPSARMVLLKNVDQHGFVFYSNYNSRKGRELEKNSYGALVLYWSPLDRQVRIEGTIEKIPEAESDAYFSTRPRDSQISSWASSQSTELASREELDDKFDQMKRKFEGKPVPRPPHWGGYRLKPVSIEFWQQRFARLNDRILYTMIEDGRWSIQRLAP